MQNEDLSYTKRNQCHKTSTEIYLCAYNFSLQRRMTMPTIERLNLEVLGDRVRQRRKARQLSQQEVAALMHIPQSWISDVENGKRLHVEADTIYRCCRALGCSLDY